MASRLSSSLLWVTLGCLVSLSLATHFRFGLITYDQSASSDGTTIVFSMQQAWRWTFFGSPAVGSTLTITPFNYAGTSATVNPTWRVNSVSNINDWFVATVIPFSITYNLGTATVASYTAYTTSCCRISSLLNNRDGTWSHKALVYVKKGNNFRSIKSSMVPITALLFNVPATFEIGTLPQQNEFVTFRIATNSDAANGGSWVPPTGLTVGWLDGVVSWTPQTAGLWTLQVVIIGNTNPAPTAAVTTSQQSWFGLDWILQVIDPNQLVCKRFCAGRGRFCTLQNVATVCGSCPIPSGCINCRAPFCAPNPPPYWTNVTVGSQNYSIPKWQSKNVVLKPVFGTMITVLVNVQTDAIDQLVTVYSGAIPTGLTISSTIREGFTRATITWTPGVDDLAGAVVCLQGADELGYPTIGNLCLLFKVQPGTLSANGTGLTYAVAGANTFFDVRNAPSRVHSLSMTGPTSVNGTVTDQGVSFTDENGINLRKYTGGYNITRAGLYILTLADTTSSLPLYPPSVLSTLTVVPNVTIPSRSVLYDQGSTGTVGGESGRNLTFFLKAYDLFGNVQSLQRTDSFSYNLTYLNTANVSQSFVGNLFWDPITVAGIVDYRYKGFYVVPNNMGWNKNYTLTIWYKSSPSSAAVHVRRLNLTSSVPDLQILVSDPTFIAGQGVWFTFTSNKPPSCQSFTGTIGGIPGVFSCVSTSTTATYNMSLATVLTQAGKFPNGIVLSAAGLAGGAGVQYFGYTVIPGLPDASASIIRGLDLSVNILDMKASSNAVAVIVLLRDMYGNPCEETYNVNFTVVNSGSSNALQSGNAEWDSDNPDSYFFPYTPSVSGESTWTVIVSGGGLTSAVTLTPLTGVVLPGDFSSKKSEAKPSAIQLRDTVAGTVEKTVTVVAKDFLGNTRNPDLPGVDRDNFNTTFYKSTTTGLRLSKLIPNPASSDGGIYLFPYSTTSSGQWFMDIAYQAASVYLPFVSLPIKVWAGTISVPNIAVQFVFKSFFYNSRAEVIIRSKDQYNNTIEDRTGGRYLVSDSAGVPQVVVDSSMCQSYFVEVISVNKLVKTLYKTGYCAPSASAPKTCATSFSEEQKLSGPAMKENTTYDDQSFYAEGYFRAFFKVPKRIYNNGNFTVKVYLANDCAPGVNNNTAWRNRINDTSTVLVGTYNFVVTDNGQLDGAATEVNMAVIFGAAAATFFITGVGYGAWRLARYRPKYIQEKKKADEAENILEEMRDEAILPGARDGNAVGAGYVTRNPLHEANKLDYEQMHSYAMENNPILKMDNVAGSAPAGTSVRASARNLLAGEED